MLIEFDEACVPPGYTAKAVRRPMYGESYISPQGQILVCNDSSHSHYLRIIVELESEWRPAVFAVDFGKRCRYLRDIDDIAEGTLVGQLPSGCFLVLDKTLPTEIRYSNFCEVDIHGS